MTAVQVFIKSMEGNRIPSVLTKGSLQRNLGNAWIQPEQQNNDSVNPCDKFQKNNASIPVSGWPCAIMPARRCTELTSNANYLDKRTALLRERDETRSRAALRAKTPA
jgi:hypothetical protein